MIKLAESNEGSVTRHGVQKTLTDATGNGWPRRRGWRLRFSAGWAQKRRIVFLGTINAGHPGGSLPLTEREAGSWHHERLPHNLYVSDASLLPLSGQPADPDDHRACKR